MRGIQLIPQDTKINFFRIKTLTLWLSIFLIIVSIGLIYQRGLNFGIDFTGGILIEARFETAPNVGELRELLRESIRGDIALQQLGTPVDIMIRVQKNDDTKQIYTINKVKTLLADTYGPKITYRKVDYVGPQVGSELIKAGAFALISAFLAILLYIWFRFEWQFGLGAIFALIHDVILTLGFFSLTQLEFNLSSIAAILTIIGYSINDSVVIFDRIRENLRKFSKTPLSELLNISINNTLSRTLLTAGTTIVALLALIIFGGPVVQSFSMAMLFGVIIGTYSSIYIAAPVLHYMGYHR